ncbi:MAG: hypothetical protein E7436_03260 [Ruminococcaceae bacterium]|nr:hypothetical protein [Oscillospiraceae bacterium]
MNKLKRWFLNFMAGRYGTDKLNMTMLWTSVIVMVVSLFCSGWLQTVLVLVYYALLILALMRTFSRNTYKRYQENRKFLMLLDRIKDRQHRYFDCPRCRQVVRVPRGKGKIAITCPKCGEKFIKKS